MHTYAYPVALTPDADDGGFVVTFPDLPEAITQGDDVEDALIEAADCLEEAIAHRITLRLDLPVPSLAEEGQRLVAVPLATGLKAAFYLAIRESGLSDVQLTARLGLTEGGRQELLDPRKRTDPACIEACLRRLGRAPVLSTVRPTNFTRMPEEHREDAEQASQKAHEQGTSPLDDTFAELRM